MAITTLTPLGIQPTPDGMGLQYFALCTQAGDASGGAITIHFTHAPWRESWVFLDRWMFLSDNAATDKYALDANAYSFKETGCWIGAIDCGLISESACVNGGTGFKMPDREMKSVYIGRYEPGSGNPLLQAIITPNTNLKTYYVQVAGRIFWVKPTMRMLSR